MSPDVIGLLHRTSFEPNRWSRSISLIVPGFFFASKWWRCFFTAVNSRPRQKSEDAGQWNVRLRNSRTKPLAATRAKQNKDTPEECEQDNAKHHFEGMLT